MKSILDPTFRYINAARTDIRATFARIRREQKASQAKPAWHAAIAADEAADFKRANNDNRK